MKGGSSILFMNVLELDWEEKKATGYEIYGQKVGRENVIEFRFIYVMWANALNVLKGCISSINDFGEFIRKKRKVNRTSWHL